MNILHYSLGFPPYRSGGLTKYSIDLAMTQKAKGHKVYLMWPGTISKYGNPVNIKVKSHHLGIISAEIINPLPIPLDEGIIDTEYYMARCKNPDIFAEFLIKEKIQVIHIHTLMGLHKEFLLEANKLSIKIIFSSHDYFGICPRVTLFREGKICDGSCEFCYNCNREALSLKKIKLMQTPLYRKLKDSFIVKTLRKRHRKQFFDENNNLEVGDNNIIHNNKTKAESKKNQYEKLRNYYVESLKKCDEIHFNSTVTEKAYRQFIPDSIKGRVINITHNSIRDNRRTKKFKGKLKIVYLAPAKPFKGYVILKQALDELWDQGTRDFEINMYNEAVANREYMHVHKSYAYQELENIFEYADLLIMPSIWYETFGFTVLEAISYGVPVIVTECVGAKDILNDGKYGMIIEPTKHSVKKAIEEVINNREILEKYNKTICEELDIGKIINSNDEIEKMY